MLVLGSSSALVSSHRCSFFINTIHTGYISDHYKSRGMGQLAVVAYQVECWTDNTKVQGLSPRSIVRLRILFCSSFFKMQLPPSTQTNLPNQRSPRYLLSLCATRQFKIRIQLFHLLDNRNFRYPHETSSWPGGCYTQLVNLLAFVLIPGGENSLTNESRLSS